MPEIESINHQTGNRFAFVGIAVHDSQEDALVLVEETPISRRLARDADRALVRAVDIEVDRST